MDIFVITFMLMAYLSTYKDFIVKRKTPHLQLHLHLKFVVGNDKLYQKYIFAIERYYLHLKTTKVNKYK